MFLLVSQQVKKSEAVGLVCLATLLVAIYLIWLLLTIRYHCQVGSHGTVVSYLQFLIIMT